MNISYKWLIIGLILGWFVMPMLMAKINRPD